MNKPHLSIILGCNVGYLPIFWLLIWCQMYQMGGHSMQHDLWSASAQWRHALRPGSYPAAFEIVDGMPERDSMWLLVARKWQIMITSSIWLLPLHFNPSHNLYDSWHITYTNKWPHSRHTWLFFAISLVMTPLNPSHALSSFSLHPQTSPWAYLILFCPFNPSEWSTIRLKDTPE
jgi:hypothetical protein